jgi:hypothetical protein
MYLLYIYVYEAWRLRKKFKKLKDARDYQDDLINTGAGSANVMILSERTNIEMQNREQIANKRFRR